MLHQEILARCQIQINNYILRHSYEVHDKTNKITRTQNILVSLKILENINPDRGNQEPTSNQPKKCKVDYSTYFLSEGLHRCLILAMHLSCIRQKKKKCFEIVNIEHPEADQDLH